jgi:hypothetical protein
VVHGISGHRAAGWLYDPSTGTFIPDVSSGGPLSDLAVRTMSSTTALTFTAVPLHAGPRLALDRDLDGVLDGDHR